MQVAVDEAALALTIAADPSLFGATAVQFDNSRPAESFITARPVRF